MTDFIFSVFAVLTIMAVCAYIDDAMGMYKAKHGNYNPGKSTTITIAGLVLNTGVILAIPYMGGADIMTIIVLGLATIISLVVQLVRMSLRIHYGP